MPAVIVPHALESVCSCKPAVAMLWGRLGYRMFREKYLVAVSAVARKFALWSRGVVTRAT